VESCRVVSGEGIDWWRVVELSVETVVIGGELSRYKWRR
jgi:hypothetical protein